MRRESGHERREVVVRATRATPATLKSLVAVLTSVLILGAPGVSRAGDAPEAGARAPAPDLEALLDGVAPAIVSLQFLVKFESGEEGTTWAHGTVVDPTGLVMLSNSDVAAGEAKVAEIKVVFGNDPKEWEGVLVARESTLDLAYVQVLGLGETKVPALDLAKAVESRKGDPRLGEPLFGASRAGRGFDYAPSIARSYLTCRIENPRRMWDLAGDFYESGLPLFDMSGRPAAILVNQTSTAGADEGGGSHSGVFALPLGPVVKSLEQARTRVPAAMKKAEESKKDAPKEEAPKPPAPPPAMDEAKPPEAPATPKSAPNR